MLKDWPHIATEMSGLMKELRVGVPDVMKAFGSLIQAAEAPKALDTKT